MNGRDTRPGTTFGGSWTKEKLDVLERYLDAYTTALKDQPFSLWYIDAFAGTGDVRLKASAEGTTNFLAGSAKRALAVGSRPFDELVFVEQDADRCEELDRLRVDHPSRSIRVEKAEANIFLRRLAPPGDVRGVLFLDPFATQVAMSTLEHVARLQQFDTWILFPVSAVARLLPRSRRPDDVSEAWVERLNHVYGDESWSDLYVREPQQKLWGPPDDTRVPGVAGLCQIYLERLADVFGARLLTRTAQLRNSTRSVLFEFMFCVGHPRGIGPAKRIARHLLKSL